MGSPTLNNEILPTVAAFLTYLKGLRPQNKTGFVFGSYGWVPNVLDSVAEVLKLLKWNLPEAPFKQKYVPTEENLEELKGIVLRVINSAR